MMAAGYDMRSADGRNRKQSMAELKLRRLQELNARLKEDLERRRIPVSEAANEYVHIAKRGDGWVMLWKTNALCTA
jgi:guanine nucleotide-binding protein subunit gamma